jgi:hypothetical protein
MSATNRGSVYVENGAYYTPSETADQLVAVLPFLDRSRRILEPSVGGGAFLRAILAREKTTLVFHRLHAIDVDPRAPGLAAVKAEGGWTGVGDFLELELPKVEVVIGNPPFGEPQGPTVCPKCSGTGQELRREQPTHPIEWDEHEAVTKRAPSPGWLAVTHEGKPRWRGPCSRCDGTGIYTPPPLPAAERHVRRALDAVPVGGHVVFLLRLAFLESVERAPLFIDHPLRQVWVLRKRPSFVKGRTSSTDSAAYGWFWWVKGYAGKTALDFL